MAYIDDHFLLYNDTARRLYHEVAAHQPIIDTTITSHLQKSPMINDGKTSPICGSVTITINGDF